MKEAYYYKYRIDHNVKMETIWFIRQINDKKNMIDAIINGTPSQDGQPKGTGIGDSTSAKAIKASALIDDVRAIEGSLNNIPEEYRTGVFENLVYRKAFPKTANEKTWKMWRHIYIYHVALSRKR